MRPGLQKKGQGDWRDGLVGKAQGLGFDIGGPFKARDGSRYRNPGAEEAEAQGPWPGTLSLWLNQ